MGLIEKNVEERSAAPEQSINLGSLGPLKDLPEREIARLVSARQPRFQVVISRSVLEDIREHGKSQPEVEICGVLVGNVYRDQSGPFLHIDGSIRGNNAAGKSTQVTFTAETWNHIQSVMEKEHEGDRIVGWYHTHPGFGIFLSDMDLFIQNNFFSEAWQVAFVYDPKSNEQGLFLRRDNQTIREKFLIDEEKDGVEGGRQADASGQTQMVAPGTIAELSARVQSIEGRLRWHGPLMWLLLFIALLWPVAVFLFGSTIVKSLPPELQRLIQRTTSTPEVDPVAAPGKPAATKPASRPLDVKSRQ